MTRRSGDWDYCWAWIDGQLVFRAWKVSEPKRRQITNRNPVEETIHKRLTRDEIVTLLEYMLRLPEVFIREKEEQRSLTA